METTVPAERIPPAGTSPDPPDQAPDAQVAPAAEVHAPGAESGLPVPRLPSDAAEDTPAPPDAAPEPAGDADAAQEPAPAREPAPGARTGARPLWARAVLAVAAVVLLGAAAYQLGTVFLSVAPPNPVSQRFHSAVSAQVYPEFEQNWQLFAPDPLQADVHVEARVQTLAPGGARADSGWIDVSARDLAAIRHDPAPSHLDLNQLRRAWDYYASWHSTPGEAPTGTAGALSTEYLKRIVLQRLGRRDRDGLPIVQIQLRGAGIPVTGPSWTGAPAHAKPSYRTLPWWPVDDSDWAGLGVPACRCTP